MRHREKQMPSRGEVLVAIVNDRRDFLIAREEHWYRIPVDSVDKRLKERWPPNVLAFYQTREFGTEAYSVTYFAEVERIKRVMRRQLFPKEPRNAKSENKYYKIVIGELQRLSKPIPSKHFRRIVFIPTTREKLAQAEEINDLFDESSLEDKMWVEFKRAHISAERQEFVKAKRRDYALDFAIYCHKGKINVETDGDVWHSNPRRASEDNRRDNDLKTVGWQILRFNTQQVHEELKEYCMPTVAENINRLGGLNGRKLIPRKIILDPDSGVQLSIFDDR